MPWENPSTGARGTITPLAAAYNQDGMTCRDFLASYVRNGAEVLAAGRGLPRHAGPVGSAPHEALAAHLTAPISALQAGAPVPTLNPGLGRSPAE